MHFSRMCDALVPEPPGDLGPNHPGGAGVWNECVYGCMNDYKEIEGVGSVYLDDLSDRVWRASVRNVRPGPVLVVHDRVGMAHMGHPFAPYLSLGVFLSCSIDFGSPIVSLGWRSHSWAFPSSTWEGGGPLACGGALFLTPGCAVVVGHT